MLILPTCGCCWAPLGCLFPRGLTKCGSALHPSVVRAQQALEMPPCLLEMESAEAAAEVGEASLLRAELDSKVQCCNGAAGESAKPSSSHFCFLQCSERQWMLKPLVELLGHEAASAPALKSRTTAPQMERQQKC